MPEGKVTIGLIYKATEKTDFYLFTNGQTENI